MSNNSLNKQIHANMELKETEELLEIWNSHDVSEWTPEALEIVKEILLLRLGEIPVRPAIATETRQTKTTIPSSVFLSIWLKPRETIRAIVETNSTQYVLLLAMLTGVGQALDRASSRDMGIQFHLLVFLAFVLFWDQLEVSFLYILAEHFIAGPAVGLGGKQTKKK